MSQTPVPFAPETLETIQRAFRVATDRRHDTVGLEHLLRAVNGGAVGRGAPHGSCRGRRRLAVPGGPQARRILVSCGIDLDMLRRQLNDVLAKAFTPVP